MRSAPTRMCSLANPDMAFTGSGSDPCCAGEQETAAISARQAANFVAVIGMGFPHFIARRILGDRDRQDRLSRPIVLIAVLGIVIGMAVMIVTVSISTGFQREIRSKVTGTGAHLQITAIAQTDPKETQRVSIRQDFLPALDSVPGIAHVQVFATHPGIIETGEEIQGVVVKGVGADQDWTFLRRHLVEGDVLDIDPGAPENELLLSRYLARRLEIATGDTITVYLVKGREDIRPRKFRVRGIFETGVEAFDHQVVLVDIAHLQRFAQWGLQAEILVLDSVVPGGVLVEGLAFGGDRIFRYAWPGTDFEGKGPHRVELPPETSRRITLVVHDADSTLPDTSWVELRGEKPRFTPVHSRGGGELVYDSIAVARGGSGGSHTLYAGGFEVALDDFDDLLEMDDRVYRELPIELRTLSVRERFPEIFAWLDLLDTNVIVVIVLMIIVAIINMTSALLIIILERTTMIGVLKALGASNGAIRRIFLIDAAYILGTGILLGDLLGIGLCLLQRTTGLVTLPIESYYVNAVPVLLDPVAIVLLNAGTLLVCVAALVLPSALVSRIAPARAIRFE